jgi:superoxide dismutase
MKIFQHLTLCVFALTSIFQPLKAQSKFELPALPYAYDALEPFIDASTMQIHHSKHHQGYVTKLNEALAGTDTTGLTLEAILANVSKYTDAVRNNAGGHYNHSLFWSILTPNKRTAPSKRLNEAIVKEFGSVDSLKIALNQAASKQFGSGWAWLCVSSEKKLFISSTPNQDNPMMDIATKKGTPILGIDVWEHAYYLKYQNKRGDYLAAIWNVINWEEVSKRYETLVPKGKFDEWQALKDFHRVMAQTFHPSEEGDLEPIKKRSAEMMEKAEVLAKSDIPAEFDRKEVKIATKKLASDSKKLHQLIQNKGTDEAISKTLSDLHDTFHTIIGLCTAEEHH